MTGLAVAALLVAVIGGGIGLTLVVLGGRRIRRQRAVDRVALPARLISSTMLLLGIDYVVEYPGPDGRPLRGTAFSVAKRTLSSRGYRGTARFNGVVYAARNDPSDIVLEPHPRTLAGTIALIVGVVTLFASVVVAANLALSALLK